MAEQNIYTPRTGSMDTYSIADVRADLLGLIDEFNKSVGIIKMMAGLFTSAYHSGTNGGFGNSFATVDSVSITLTVNSLVFIAGLCDARFGDSNLRSVQSRIVTNNGSGDVVQTTAVFSVIGATTSSQLRGLLATNVAVPLNAGVYTLKFQCQNNTDSNSMTSDNSQISAIAVPNR